MGNDVEFLRHLEHLSFSNQENKLEEAVNAPLFTKAVQDHAEKLKETPFPQYALLAGRADRLENNPTSAPENDPRIFHNIAVPWSAFICGSQGSGKSHTLSCLLENCLVPSDGLGKLPHPLAGIVFHYDSLTGEEGGSPCEAAFLASSKKIKVQILCSPSNMRSMANTYAAIPEAKIQPLKLSDRNLNTSRMFSLMGAGAGENGGSLPLYFAVLQKILREMRVDQQRQGIAFQYDEFTKRLAAQNLTEHQMVPLRQRLDCLESFMDRPGNSLKKNGGNGNVAAAGGEYDWTPKPGHLTIIDLSCPCITPDMACSLFSIGLSLFLEAKPSRPSSLHSSTPTSTFSPTIGRIIALDEAHKYLGSSLSSTSPSSSSNSEGGKQVLTSSLLSTIRLQRHLGARVIIATQEPTVNPRLLDLCSVAIVHRFGSPEWMRALQGRLAGAAASGKKREGRGEWEGGIEGGRDGEEGDGEEDDQEQGIFERIIRLGVGEALLFAPVMGVGVRDVRKAKTIGGINNDGMILSKKKKKAKEYWEKRNGKSGKEHGNGKGRDIEEVEEEVVKLGAEVLTVRVRKRVTVDGGKSIMAD